MEVSVRRRACGKVTSRTADRFLGCCTLSRLLGMPCLEAYAMRCRRHLPPQHAQLPGGARQPEKAKEVLRRVRGTPDVDTEFQSIMVANKVMENMENPGAHHQVSMQPLLLTGQVAEADA